MKLFITIFLIFSLANISNATVHIVTCQNSPAHFLPTSLNAFVGDTIHWKYIAGNHIVGPVNANDIPNGAAMWAGLIDAAHLTFDYVVTKSGTYNYDCHPATPHGENASITVLEVTGILPRAKQRPCLVFPNPFADTFHFKSESGGDFNIFNLKGEKVYFYAIKENELKYEPNMAQLSKGIYFCTFTQQGNVVSSWKLLKE